MRNRRQNDSASEVAPQFPFSNLSPSAFLQAFLNEMMRVCDEHGLSRRDELIEHIGLNAGENFESAYRYEFALGAPLDAARYADLILGIKNRIGGNFSLASSTKDCVRVVNTRCPFGDRVKDFPELCHMTSSVFGGIAARNFGYAKVELRKRIATHDGMCEVCIHTNPQEATKYAGTEYRRDDVPAIKPLPCETRQRVEERMRAVWCPVGKPVAPIKERERASIVAHSPSMHDILLAVEMVAPTLATVLITGETGVGKEVVARAIHAMSDRWNRNFVAVNCGAIPETLIETTLFGHEKGAFTGAYEVHHGLFHRAEGGTLFLDEVNTLSAATQVKLLRVLQEGEYERVGGNHTLLSDVRIVAASNFPLDQALVRGEFRQDLFYRLNVVRLEVPPLRVRPEDIPYLVDHLLGKLRHKHHKPIHAVSPRVMRQLTQYAWPGNVRELENVLERSFVFATGSRIEQVELPKQTNKPANPSNELSAPWAEVKKQALEDIEKRHLELTLKRFNGNVTVVAKWMELTPRAVYQKLTRYRLNPGAFRVL
ncbi:MAG: sigma 54-interacting transcriptional regulator [Gammaproteobacteria bacterium]